jgi:hypothetical protein
MAKKNKKPKGAELESSAKAVAAPAPSGVDDAMLRGDYAHVRRLHKEGAPGAAEAMNRVRLDGVQVLVGVGAVLVTLIAAMLSLRAG